MFTSIFSHKWLIISLSIFSSTAYFEVKSQSYQHSTAWTRVLISKQINPKFFVSGEFMLRRQNNYINSKLNFLENPLGNAERIIFAYRPKKWQFSFAPSRWFTYQLIGKGEDFEKKPTTEWRFTPGIELFQPIKKATFSWRTQYEYRYFADRTAGRFRQRFQYRFPISENSDFLIGNEFLFGFPPNSTKRYDQNQLHFLWMPKLSKHLDMEIGYRWVYRKRRLTEEKDFENALVMSLFVRL